MTIAIGGGGPAGLTAAYELTRHGLAPTVFESLPLVGGIARTEEYKGYRFDLGGHRFFSKSEEINALWPELLGAPLMTRERLSRGVHCAHEAFGAFRAGFAAFKTSISWRSAATSAFNAS